MKTLNSNTIEMNLTSREIKLIAIEAQDVDTNNPRMTLEFSNRVQDMIIKAVKDARYVVRRCYYLTYGVKMA